MHRLGSRLQTFFASATRRWYFWALFFVAAFSLPVARSMTRDIGPPPEIYAELPGFDLVDESGKPFTLEQLRGKVWVANFIFTSCSEVCPRLSNRMREVQERISNMGDAAQLVSFSVDPQRDTPERLAEYARRFHANAKVWNFVTGPYEEIEKTVEQGFKIAMEKNEDAEADFFDIVHGEHFVLVDQLGRIRGYYRSEDDAELQRLLNELGYLANLGPDGPETGRSMLSSTGDDGASPSR